MNYTLSSIVDETGLSRSTVKRAFNKACEMYGELGQCEGNGKPRLFNAAEVDTIKSFLSEPKPAKGSEAAEPVKCEIVGTETTTVDAPMVPTTVNLAKFGATSTAIDLSTVDDVLALVDQFSEVLDTDLEARWNQYNQTTNAAKQLAKKVEALQEKRKAYEIETRILANLQSDAVATVKEQLGNVEALGA